MIATVMEILTSVASWFTTTITSMLPIFYDSAEGNLTFLGVLALISVAIGLATLVFNYVKDFLKFR